MTGSEPEDPEAPTIEQRLDELAPASNDWPTHFESRIREFIEVRRNSFLQQMNGTFNSEQPATLSMPMDASRQSGLHGFRADTIIADGVSLGFSRPEWRRMLRDSAAAVRYSSGGDLIADPRDASALDRCYIGVDPAQPAPKKPVFYTGTEELDDSE